MIDNICKNIGEINDVKSIFSKHKGYPELQLIIQGEKGEIVLDSLALNTLVLNATYSDGTLRDYITRCVLNVDLVSDENGAYGKAKILKDTAK